MLNLTLEEAFREEERRPRSPLRSDPKVMQDSSSNSFDPNDFNIVPRNDTEGDNYYYNEPKVLNETIYYTRPGYTQAFCTKGPDDV